MEAPSRQPGHMPDGQPRTATALPPGGRRLLRLATPGFLICAAVAIGYGLWALYGSGSEVETLEMPGPGRGSSAVLGPILIEPGMNPLRAVLRAAHAPVGSTRLRYEIEMVDPAGRTVWIKRAALGSTDDEASIIWTTTGVAVFDVTTVGEHFVRVHFADRGMDDLREAKVELRRNVAPVDARIPWGFGLASLACLIVGIVASHRRRWPYHPAEEGPRAAA